MTNERRYQSYKIYAWTMLHVYCIRLNRLLLRIVLWYHSMQQQHKVDTKMDIWKASFFFTKSSYLVE